MKYRIDASKLLYDDMFKKNGGENEASLKLKDDISFMENMYGIIEAQVNGLVSRQASWKKRVEQIQNSYDKQVKVSSAWENIRRKNPWITTAMGTGLGAALWYSNGLNAMVQLTQYVLRLGHGSQFILDRIKPVTDFGFGVIATVGAAMLFNKIANSEMLRSFYDKHIKGNAEEIRKHAVLIGTALGAAAAFAVFAAGPLDSLIYSFQQLWRTLHTDPNIKNFINPIAEFFWGVAGMVFSGWGVNKLDRMSLAQKEKLADECEAKQLAIVQEETLFRRRIIQIIKQKAIELSAKYGYCIELDKEESAFSKLAESGDFTELNRLHKERLTRIFNEEKVPDYLLDGAAADSISTNTVIGIPQDRASANPSPG